MESEKVKSERAKDELIKRISGLLGDFTAERDRSLREAFSEMGDSNTSAEKGMVKLAQQQGEQIEQVIAGGKEWAGTLDKRRTDLKRNRDGALKVLEIHEYVYCSAHDAFSILPPYRLSRLKACGKYRRLLRQGQHRKWLISIGKCSIWVHPSLKVSVPSPCDTSHIDLFRRTRSHVASEEGSR